MLYTVMVPAYEGRSLCTFNLEMAVTWLRIHPGASLLIKILAERSNL